MNFETIAHCSPGTEYGDFTILIRDDGSYFIEPEATGEKCQVTKREAMERWLASSAPEEWRKELLGYVPEMEQGKPTGELEEIIFFEEDWSAPNVLVEDEAGQLWLAYKPRGNREETARDFEAVDVVAALTWFRTSTEHSNGYDGDPADLCRLAIGELEQDRPQLPAPF